VNEPATPRGVGTGECNSHYPVFADTRIAAGAPLANDILSCPLAPLDFEAYAVTFTADQRERLAAAFPHGVCDWNRPGGGQHDLSGVWQDFTHTGHA
jgi:hypothetical protein